MKKSSVYSVLTIMMGLAFALWWSHSIVEDLTTKRYRVPERSYGALRETGTWYQIERRQASTPVDALTLEEQQRLVVLQSILDLKNDNDPRLDSQFKTLSDREKRELEKKYLAYAPEKLNERGTLIFLLGRNLKSSQDVQFLANALAEPPCQSLNDCGRMAPQTRGEEAHEDSANALTLVYPQVVSIKSLEQALSSQDADTRALHPVMIETLKVGLNSENRLVAQMAKKVLNKFEP